MLPVESSGRCSLGCILWGCLGTSLAVLLVLGVASVGFYRFYNHQIVKYTSDAPRELPSAEVSDEEVEAISQRLEDFGTQFEQGDAPQELVITVDEINALIASNPDWRGKVHVQIVEHNLRAELSIPTDAIPGGKGRYFNGSVTLHAELEEGILIMQIVDAEANGQPIPEILMEGIRQENLAKELYKDVETKTLKRCEELIIESDRIILKVRPAKKADPG